MVKAFESVLGAISRIHAGMTLESKISEVVADCSVLSTVTS